MATADAQRSARFRPLAGFLQLSFPRRYGGSGEQREPMGALVPCVHFCRYGWFTACVHGAPSTAYAVPLPRSGRGGWRYTPSPCGDMVLKWLNTDHIPLSWPGVSVPLRGYGFEIIDAVLEGVRDLDWFPSPYGDMVLKSK